jgi:hypothetical protein
MTLRYKKTCYVLVMATHQMVERKESYWFFGKYYRNESVFFKYPELEIFSEWMHTKSLE